MTGEFSPRGGFLPRQTSREGFPEAVTPKQVLQGCGIRRMKGVWEEGSVFRDEEAALIKVGIKEWGALEAPPMARGIWVGFG